MEAVDKMPLHFQTICGLARSIREEELSPVEITEHYLSRIEALNPYLKAYRLVCRERALGEARAAEIALGSGQDLGLLHGIPYAVKDLYDVRGFPTTAGTSLLEANIASQDAHVVRRLAQAGMILLGKTNTVQFAYGGVGINHDHCTPHNPWHRIHHVPGGSSSGSAVAVASGMAPMSLGSDTGGSIRIPASLCGTVGLKPTAGRISRSSVYPLSWSLDSVGPLSRSVEDSAIVYQYLQGTDLNDDTTWGLKPQDVLKDLKRGVRGLRLAFAESAFWKNIHPEVEKAVRECGKVFRDLGANVTSIQFAEAEEAAGLNAKGLIIAAEAYTLNKKWLEEYFDQLDPVVAHRMIKGRDISANEYLQHQLNWKRLRTMANDSLKDVDVLLVPTTTLPALPVVEVDTDLDTYSELNVSYLRNTSIGNILGMCGVSVPCGFTEGGLPIGLMLYGKAFQEDVVLRAGYAFEQVTGWHKRNPELSWVGN
jgi:aspartyl-tRNA(Asn)/glutamyl-tRNA(Gln) amidotransferase subunit A